MRMNRRAFLRGTGSIAIALPILEVHSTVLAQTAPRLARRIVVLFSHGGIINRRRRGEGAMEPQSAWFGYDLWRPPTESETLTALGEEMASLEPLKQELLLLRGIWSRAGKVQGPYGGGGHGYSNVTALIATGWP